MRIISPGRQTYNSIPLKGKVFIRYLEVQIPKTVPATTQVPNYPTIVPFLDSEWSQALGIFPCSFPTTELSEWDVRREGITDACNGPGKVYRFTPMGNQEQYQALSDTVCKPSSFVIPYCTLPESYFLITNKNHSNQSKSQFYAN